MSKRDVSARIPGLVHNGHAVASEPRVNTPSSGENTDYVELSTTSLLPADSPRLAGENEEHIRLLAESNTDLPPIVVHRQTMRVVDGMHRLRAAMLRGQETIRARLIDGTMEAAFVVAVEANIAHGLPLSLVDRESAAARIVGSHPHWSDRAIANITGISARTVAVIRRGVTADQRQSGSRIGKDGRVRPVNGAEGRRRAGELLERRPNASLREVAREAGISVGTALDVRERVNRGEDPVRPGQRRAGQRREAGVPDRTDRTDRPDRPPRRPRVIERPNESRDRATILRNLRRDPAIRFTDCGRELLRWLDMHAVGVDGWKEAVATVPAHTGYVIAELAQTVAEEWLELAEHLRRNLDQAEATAAPGAASTVEPEAGSAAGSEAGSSAGLAAEPTQNPPATGTPHNGSSQPPPGRAGTS